MTLLFSHGSFTFVPSNGEEVNPGSEELRLCQEVQCQCSDRCG